MDTKRTVGFLCLLLGLGCSGGDPAPAPAPPKSKAIAFAAGENHTCAVLSNNTVMCWGSDSGGQLGGEVGTGTSYLHSTTVPVAGVKSLTSVTALAAGRQHNCALLLNSTVKCWGGSVWGELGDSHSGFYLSPATGLTSVLALTAMGHHTCARLADSTVRCWGLNNNGQLGLGTRTGPESCYINLGSTLGSIEMYAENCGKSPFPVPFPVNGSAWATAVTAGWFHTCAVMPNSTVACWGGGTYGQLGNGMLASTFSPVIVNGLTSATALALGVDHTCALLLNSTVQCWGRNHAGQLGTGSLTDAALPMAVPGLTSVTALVAGNDHTCALIWDTTVRCWGENSVGQVGDRVWAVAPVPFTIRTPRPMAVTGLTSVLALTAGGNHTCALLADSSIQCWGYNYYGQLGVGTQIGPEFCSVFSCSTRPVTVSGF